MARLAGRLAKALKASAEALLTPAEDPRRTYAGPDEQQRILFEQVRAAEDRLVTIRARLEERRESADARTASLENEARAALVAGRENEARIALQRERIARLESEQLGRQIEGLLREETRLAGVTQRIAARIEQSRARERLAAARHTAAQAQVAVGEALSGVDVAEESIAVERIERDADELQARADAIEELMERGVLGALPAEIEEKTDQEIEERLAALKRTLLDSQP